MRTIEILFIGIFLFIQQDKEGIRTYEVMIPDGRSQSKDSVFPEHEASLWFLRKDAEPQRAAWAWPAGKRCKLEFSGLAAGTVEDAMFKDRVPNVRDSDPEFKLRRWRPAAIARGKIDRGVLSAHKFEKGMIAVKWTVKSDGEPFTIRCGNKTITVPSDVTQVAFGNVSMDHTKGEHFRLYRRVATNDKEKLATPNPRQEPGGPFEFHRPDTKGAMKLPMANGEFLDINTPFVDCSGAGYP